MQVGLPPASKNADTWPIKKALLGMPGLVAPPVLIRETKAFLHAMLRLRYSSPLFRLPAAAILDQVRAAHVLGLPRKHALPPCAAPRWVIVNAQYAWVGAGR